MLRGMGATMSPAWQAALQRIRAARQAPHYLPAMLIAVLDHLDRGTLELPSVWFEPMEQQFLRVLVRRRLPGTDKAWDPFFHLSVRARVWTLWLGEAPADFSDLPKGAQRATPRPKSRPQLVARADHAEFLPELVPQLRLARGRELVRRELEAMLVEDV